MKSITAKRARRGPTSRTWCVAHRKPLFLRRRAPRLPGPWRRWRAGRGAPLPANPYSFVAEHHVFRGHGAGGGPDVVRRSLQPLFLRHRAPRLPGPWRQQRAGRGAPLPANPYSFVTEHHVFRGHGAGVGVTRRKTMALRGARRQLGRPRAGRFRFFISNSMTFLRIRNN